MAQLVQHPTLAQVMVSQFMNLSPTSGLLLSVQSLLQILCPPFSAPPLLTLSLIEMSLSKINILKKSVL